MILVKAVGKAKYMQLPFFIACTTFAAMSVTIDLGESESVLNHMGNFSCSSSQILIVRQSLNPCYAKNILPVDSRDARFLN